MVINLSNALLWDELYSNFDSEDCKNCFLVTIENYSISHPQPIPFIGPKYENDNYRLMFVGIETYGNIPRHSLKTSYDEGKFGENRTWEHFEGRNGDGRGAFWRWLREITKRIYDNDNLEYLMSKIVYTNLHKCQVRPGKNATEDEFDVSKYYLEPNSLKHCIQDARWIHKEIDYLNPKNIVIFSGRKYDGLIARILYESLGGKPNEITYFPYRNYGITPNEQKKKDIFMHFKDAHARRYIITNHPQYTSPLIKEEIIKIIKQNK